jgi:hypothetical protein
MAPSVPQECRRRFALRRLWTLQLHNPKLHRLFFRLSDHCYTAKRDVTRPAREHGEMGRHDGGTQRTTPRYEEEFGGCRAPPASFIRPLALSIAPSFLSRRPRFVPTVRSLLLSQSASRHANPKLRAAASRVIPPRLSPRSRRSRMSCSSSHLLLLPRRR